MKAVRNEKQTLITDEAARTPKQEDEQAHLGDTLNLLNFPSENERLPQSYASPTLLSLDYATPFIISAAVLKDPNNVSVQRSGYYPIYFSYNSSGDLDHVTDHSGTIIATASYCTSTEVYYCPKGWVDYIDLAPLGSHTHLEFFYTSDTPNTDYYAAVSGEPELFFYNINMADGSSVDATSPLYEGDGYPKILTDTSQITGYVAGVTAINPDWSLWFDAFSNQRVTNIGNRDNSKMATFSASTAKAIYRFWSSTKQHHFFTMTKSEKNIVRNTNADSVWHYEGVANKGYDTQQPGTTAVYRFWSDAKQGHFYTASAAEKDNIVATDPSWHYEGVSYYVYATEQASTSPVYRFWSAKKQGHFFTNNSAEKDSIIATDPSWHYEGIAWYVPSN